MINVPTFNELVNNLCRPSNHYIVKDAIEILKSEKVLQDFELEFLGTFEKVIKTTGSVPTQETIAQHIPTFRCESSMQIDDMLGSTRIFVRNRLNKQVSNRFITLSDKISKEGITEEIATEINQMTMSDAVVSTFTKIQDNISDIFKKGLDRSGIKTHTRKIDDFIGSLKAGQISTVAGYTSAGKSTFVVSLTHEAIKQGFNVCYLSLELPREHLMYNLLSRHSVDTLDNGQPRFTMKVVHSDLKNRTQAVGEWEYCEDKILPSLNNLKGNYYIVDQEDIDAYTFFAFNNKLQEIENLAVKETGKGIDLIVVDYIQMMKYSGLSTKVSEFEVTNMWVNYFRGLALDFLKTKRQVHVIMAAQINRGGWLKAAKREGEYDLTALAESNEIEKASSVIISLFSDERLKESKEIKFQILKNRDGMKRERVDSLYCDFAHQMIGGETITSDTDFVKSTFEDLGEISKSDIDVSHVTDMQIIEDQFDF